MNAIFEQINPAGKAFVVFALPMLIQSSVLIAILLFTDLVLRRRVRAVFRYWLWLLVLAKLVLPTSLSSPVSLGYWLGDRLKEVGALKQVASVTSVKESLPSRPRPVAADEAAPILIDPLSEITRPPVPVRHEPEPAIPSTLAEPLSWQGAVFLAWAAVVIAMGLLLVQRAIFVRRLTATAKEANDLMKNALEFCRRQMRVQRNVGLRVSPKATSPAVCGLFKPLILLPGNLAPNLGSSQLRTVLLHELAHIKRGDLWVNLIQTVLQIVYFYNPLLWLANAIIRRVREQAVDEAVLVAMGEKAQRYPETLVNVAKLAFKRPALSLRLIGVVESKNALASRIKRILNRPIPKSAKLGVLGLVLVSLIGAVLLPMATAKIKAVDIVTECKLFSKQYESLMRAWKRSNSTAEQIRDTYLVIDTDKEAMWIERNGVVSNSERAALVKNLEWEIYHVTPSGKTALSSPVRLNLRSTPAHENVTQELFFFNGRLGNSSEGCTFEISRHGYGSGFPYAENWNFTFNAKKMPENVDSADIIDKTMLVTPEEYTEARTRSISQEKYGTFAAETLNKTDIVNKFRATLANGVTVELLGVCEHPSEGKQWWRPDGQRLDYTIKTLDTNTYPSDDPGYEFIFRKNGNADFKIESIKGSNVNSGLRVIEPEDLTGYRAHIKKGYKKTNIKIASPSGKWKTAVTSSGKGSVSGKIKDKTIVFAGAEQAGKDVMISCSDIVGYKNATRIIAVDPKGKELTGKTRTDTGVNNVRQRTIRFSNLDLADIAEFKFQTCSYEYYTFKNVSLKPNFKTDVQVELEEAKEILYPTPSELMQGFLELARKGDPAAGKLFTERMSPECVRLLEWWGGGQTAAEISAEFQSMRTELLTGLSEERKQFYQKVRFWPDRGLNVTQVANRAYSRLLRSEKRGENWIRTFLLSREREGDWRIAGLYYTTSGLRGDGGVYDFLANSPATRPVWGKMVEYTSELPTASSLIRYIDFDNQRLYDVPQAGATRQWLVQNGIDGKCGSSTVGGGGGLEGIDLVGQGAVFISSLLTPLNVQLMSRQWSRFGSGSGGAFLFKTREGNIGVMCVHGDAKDYFIRFKMLDPSYLKSETKVLESMQADPRETAAYVLACGLNRHLELDSTGFVRSSNVIKKIKDNQRFGPKRLDSVCVSGDVGLAVTSKSHKDDYSRFVMSLVREDSRWLVEDVQVETKAEEGTALRDFLQKHPDARHVPHVVELENATYSVSSTAVEVEEVKPARACNVVGRVLDHQDGKPVGGAKVKLWSDWTRLTRVALTRKDGTYRFDDVEPGPHLLRLADQPAGLWTEGVMVFVADDARRRQRKTRLFRTGREGGYLLAEVGPDELSAGRHSFEAALITPDDDVQQLDLYRQLPQSISGTVREESTGKPVADAAISFPSGGKPSRTVRTDADGRYCLYVRPQKLVLISEGTPSRYYPSDEKAEKVKKIAVAAGQHLRNLHFDVHSAPSFTGQVTLSDGSKAGENIDVWMVLQWRDKRMRKGHIPGGMIFDTDTVQRVKTDVNGVFKGYFRSPYDLKDSKYYDVAVEAFAWTADSAKGGVGRSKITEIDNPKVDPLEIRLEQMGSAKFRVVGPDAKAVTNAEVTCGRLVDDDPWLLGPSVKVEEIGEGYYLAEGLIPGLYYYRLVTAPGYRQESLRSYQHGQPISLEPGQRLEAPQIRLDWWGKKAVPQMVKYIRPSDEGIPYNLGNMGPDAAEAVPALVELIRESDNDTALFRAAEALGKIGVASNPVISALISLLQNRTGGPANAAAEALGRLGAVEAVGPIEAALSQGRIRPQTATIALWRIKKAANAKPIADQGPDEIVWGETVDGLQLGLAFDSAERVYRQGDVVGLRVYVRNVGNDQALLLYRVWWGTESFSGLSAGPNLRDSHGRKVAWGLRIRGAPVTESQSVLVRPGEIKLLGKERLGMGTDIEAGLVDYSAAVEPGQYRVSQKVRLGVSGTWPAVELTSDELELTVEQRPAHATGAKPDSTSRLRTAQ